MHDTVGSTGRQWPAVLVQRFPRATATTPEATLPLPEVLQAIRTGQWRLPVESVRGIYQHGSTAAYKAAKDRLPALTFGGTFHPTRSNATLTQHSGLVLGDIDHCLDVQALKARLAADPHVAFSFVSPSGAGLKIGVRVPMVTDAAGYKHAWQVAAVRYQALTGSAWDPAASAVATLCFVSYDPHLWWQPEALPLPVPAAPPFPVHAPPHHSPHASPTPARLREALARLPNADASYDIWLTVGMALHSSGLPEARALWDAWSQQSAKYDPVKQQKAWDSFHADRPQGVTLGTLFHHAAQPVGPPQIPRAWRHRPRLFHPLTRRAL